MTIPEFQGHLVRRTPTSEELARRASCRLSPRDLDILAAVGVQGLLTAELVGLAFFPPKRSDPRHASSRAYARLRQCWLWGYLDRYVLPAPRGSLGGVPDLFALGGEGVRLVTRHRPGMLPPAHTRAEDLDVRFVQHELTVATVWACLQALVRAGRLGACRWTPERAWRAANVRVPAGLNRQALRVLPDGSAELAYPDGAVRSCAVEIDRGTLSEERFLRKLRSWERYVTASLPGGDDAFDASFVVLTETWDGLTARWQAGRQVVPEAHWGRYLFGTTELLTVERFGADQAWLALTGEYCALLDGLLPRERATEKGD
jgi:hypothetical protein